MEHVEALHVLTERLAEGPLDRHERRAIRYELLYLLRTSPPSHERQILSVLQQLDWETPPEELGQLVYQEKEPKKRITGP